MKYLYRPAYPISNGFGKDSPVHLFFSEGMSMWKKKVKNLPAVVYLRREYWRHRGNKEFNKYSDYEFITKKYESLGRSLNLSDPKRFTEKLQWLKLFWRNEDMPICSDKYEVRHYLTRRGYSELLNELICEFEDLDHFDPASLPKQFVIKAAHGSGWNLIVKDKDNVNWFWWKRIMKSWLKQNLYWFGREWNYQSQKPRIVVEKYIEDESGELRDFKVFCLMASLNLFRSMKTVLPIINVSTWIARGSLCPLRIAKLMVSRAKFVFPMYRKR